MPDAFALYQPVYAAHGIATYPLTAAKTPAIRGYERVGAKGSTALAVKFAHADAFGFVAGSRNRLTVIDIDSTDQRLVDEIESRYGRTPLHVLTPSGGRHLYYRHNGEARRIRRLPYVDILGAGNVVAAGSAVPRGRYAIERGCLADLDHLAAMWPDSSQAPRQGATGRGRRNNALFDHCMRQVRHCDDFAVLLDVAETYNRDSLMPPLPNAEVVETAKSVWGYEERGENRYGITGAWFPTAEVSALLPHQDTFMLLAVLRASNGPDAEFWITNAWAATFGWTVKRMAAARKHLLDLGYIRLERAAFSGSPAVFRWREGRLGAEGGQN
jgi:bifunctional DNA primase/polymerase-like protein/primase-like protein